MNNAKEALLKTASVQAAARRREELAQEISSDYESRREQRRGYELAWQLNMNFLSGNQFCTISGRGCIEDTEKDFFWQEREVFNHLASITETRLAKLARVRPAMKVRPFSSDDADLYTAKMSTAILNYTQSKLEMDTVISEATMWSEVTGTTFYKVTWDKSAGAEAAKGIMEGGISVEVCPPFGILPDNLSAQSLKDVRSLIHVKALSIDAVRELYGVEPKKTGAEVIGYGHGASIGGVSLSTASTGANIITREDYTEVIERYTKPTKKYPCGRLEIVAGGVLVFEGDMPYINGADGARDFPFVRQCAIEQAGSFFGISVLDRAIPIQRAFNAVKNRKHEFINRLAMGVLTVEDGSVDMDNLEEEGLSPGKVLIYRQGSNPPVMMDMGRVPSELGNEEDRLLNEFITVTGISEIMRNSRVPTAVSSGIALQLLIEQDDTRLSISAESIRSAVRTMSQHILRLYKQFAAGKRLARVAGERGVEVIYWTQSDIGGDDIVFETENELNETVASKRNMVFELLKAGLLHDENGKLSNAMRAKVLSILGYGLWEDAQDLSQAHIKRAAEENIRLSAGDEQSILSIDDHGIHIREHIRHLLNSGMDKGDIFLRHIKLHELLQGAKTGADNKEDIGQ